MFVTNVVVEKILTDQVKLYYWNYLESGTVTVASENTSYPKYRLYDRAQGLLFKGTGIIEWFWISLNLGATGPYPMIDTVILGKNHNLSGVEIFLWYGDNGVDWYEAISWTGMAGINLKTFIGKQRRYWNLGIHNSPNIPEIGELFLTKEYSFERSPDWGYGHGDQKNIGRLESQSGLSQKTKYGEKKKRRSYGLTRLNDDQRIDLETFEGAIDGFKNFYIKDLKGNLFFAELPGGLPDFRSEPLGRWGIDFHVLETLD